MYELLTGLGLALPAGLNAYVPLLAVALADRYTGLIQLSEPYDLISQPWAIAIIVVLLLVEVLADKIPIVDHVNDLIQSAIRPSVGALLLMSSTSTVESINPIVSMLLGLLVAGGVHTAKTSFRPIVTATTGGMGNPIVSATEDGVAIGVTLIALIAPILIAIIVLAVASFAILVVRRRRRARSTT